VIEASAGTGKTYTLEHAVIELLLSGIPVEKLLVVTFTDRATYELRERVRALLANVVAGRLPEGADKAEHFWVIDDARREVLERALLAFDQAPIHTIHGFCQRVLTENAFVAGRLFQQELVDSKIAFASGFGHVLRHELANDPHRVVDLEAWLHAHSVEELETLLQEIDEKRADVRPQLDRDGLMAELAQLNEGVDKSLDAAKTLVAASTLHGGTKKAVLARMDALRSFMKDPEATGSVVSLHVSEKRAYIFDWLLHPDRVDDLRAVKGLRRFMSRLEGIHGKLVTVEAAAAQVFLPAVRERVALEKRTKGLYDFQDMLAIVRDALCTGPQRALLLERLRERYDHALIDEFQDTDEVQWAIFDEVFAKSPGKHGLWVIGDPKQSIYGWRGADVYAYLRASKTLGKGQKPVPLTENFRSTKPFIDACNVIFDQKAKPPFFRDKIRYDDPVVCGREKLVAQDKDGKPIAPIHVFDIDAPKMSADDLRTTLARRIAEEIRGILDKGLWLGEGKDKKRLEASDIFILTRSGWEGTFVSGFLAEQRVPFAFYKQDGLFQTAEADDVYRVLAAIAEPHDRSKRSKAWLTPFFGLELEELAAGDPPSDHVLWRQLFQWERLAERGDFRRLFASLVEDTGLVRREIFLSTSERRLTNYLHILEILLETVSQKRVGIRELSHLLHSWIAEEQEPERENGNVQRLESDAKAVQIMTLHKSKGLEAAVVFLFGGFTNPKGRDLYVYHDRPEEKTPEQLAKEKLGNVFYHDAEGRRLVHVGPLTPEVRSLVINEGDEENRRLLYVGVTRAKARVYLPGFSRVPMLDAAGNAMRDADGEPRTTWNYEYLNGTYVHLAERLDTLIHDRKPPKGFEVEKLPVLAGPAAAPGAPTPAPAWTPPAELLTVPEAKEIEKRCGELREKSAPLIVTSYTRMKKGYVPTAAEIEADTLQEETVPETSPSTPEPTPSGEPVEEVPRGGANTGQFFHDVLEVLPFESLASTRPFDEWREREEVKPLFERAMRRRGIPEGQLVGAQRMVFHTLTKKLVLGSVTLESGLAPCTKNVRELEFTYPIPEEAHAALAEGTPLTIETGWLHGFIDFIFEHEGRAYLLDWKTDTLDDYGPDFVAAHVRESYWIQVQVYTLALARMLKLKGPSDHEVKFGGVLYLFLRGMRPEEAPEVGVFFERPSWDEIKKLERELIAFEYR
jgi:exodeoxyribonuclease V beta subunit